MHWIKEPPGRFKNPGSHKLLGLAVVAGITAGLITGVSGCDENDLAFVTRFEDVQGVVLDSLTLQPIDSVTITIFDTVQTLTTYFTDTLGFFKFEIAGNQSPLFFRKQGYETKFLRADKNDTLTVLLALE